MLTKQPLPLTDFINNLQSFDIVLMHGTFPISVMSEEIEDSPYSHVGMVIVASDLANLGLTLKVEPETRLFWESNVITQLTSQLPTTQVADVLTGTGKNGPQLTKLIDRMTFNYINKYDSEFASRALQIERKPAMYQVLGDLINMVHSNLFPISATGTYLDGANFEMGRFQNQPVTDGTFFCSQLTARTFINLGLITQAYVDNSYCPADFSESPDLSLLKGAWLGKENMLDPSTLPTKFPVS